MQYISLPGISCDVSQLGFGTATIDVRNPDRSKTLLRLALRCGINYFDTARMYMGGESEKILGDFIRESDVCRERIVVATKVGIFPAPMDLFSRAVRRVYKYIPRYQASFLGPRRFAFSVADMDRSFGLSLSMLGLDSTNVLLLHGVRIEDLNDNVYRWLLEQKEVGKAQSIGIASDFLTTEKIMRDGQYAFDVVQTPLALDLNAEPILSYGSPNVIHSIFSVLYRRFREQLSKNIEQIDYWSTNIGLDLRNDENIRKITLTYTKSKYPQSIIVFGSNNASNIRDNATIFDRSDYAINLLAVKSFLCLGQ